ncbi:MAG TPA: response regulator [Planctomycetaceae bacterium]|nr:response regulator [Planctomycetaceae bacterium]
MTRILVVDDSAVDRQLVGGLLKSHYDCQIEFAANGLEALARLSDSAPDLIVTDVNMPVKDGLELMREVRVLKPNVPVVLMTAYGSEALACRALEQGATSYVPKSQLAERLVPTVEDVLARVEAERSQQQLMRCLERSEFRFVLENDPALIDPLVNLVQPMVAGMSFGDFYGRLQIGIALKQALLNALFHGNLEISRGELEAVSGQLLTGDEPSLVERRRSEPPYRDRRIYVDISISPEEARFVVRDEGSGFDTSALPDPTRAGAMEGRSGRGLSLMRTFMDEVTFNEAGNEVTLVKRGRTGQTDRQIDSSA